MKFTRQYRKFRDAYFKVAVAACLFIIFVVPFVTRFSTSVDAKESESVAVDHTSGYSVLLNGKLVGYVENPQVAKDSLLSVRAQLNEKNGTTVYAESDLDFALVEDVDDFISEEELEATLYQMVSAVSYIPTDIAYTVRINDYMVTVGSEAEVVELLNAAAARIDGTDGYQVELVDQTSRGMVERTVNVAGADITMNEAAKVLATIDGTDTVQVTEETVFKDGVLYVGFEEDIEIIQTRNSGDNVVSVEEALEMITKEKAEKTTYEVVAGDCLTLISQKTDVPLEELYALNEGLTANTTLYIGDILTVTVPKPEISVVVKKEVTYEEEYNAPIIYVDNNSMYQGQSNVVSYGSAGYREVIAVVSYSNGREYSRDIINETIITEAVPKVVERGTLIPPTFINPVNYVCVTCYYGSRIHPVTGKPDFHTGVDLYVPTGTAVKASCGGTVTMACWYGGYGYCIDVDHGNGLKTRYGHLSSIEVSVGQTVSQGQRIALSGATGNVTGPHLHFEVLLWGNAKNPFEYLNK